MKRVTMQDIADALGISRVTVWKVFNNHGGVSSSLRNDILQKATELGYTKPMPVPVPVHQKKTVSLIVSRPDSSTFWTNIIHRMAQDLAQHNINLMYTYMPTSYTRGFTLPSILESDAIQGAIILNIYDTKLIHMINNLKIPKVFLDTVPQIHDASLTGDLILLEGYSTLYRITESVISRGLTKLGFIGDIQYSKTNLDRYTGFCHCMQEHGLKVNPDYCLTDKIGIFSYAQELNQFLDSLPALPEAFICASDYIAHFLQIYFSEHSNRIPGGILITGYDGSREYDNVDGIITTANVKTSLLGKRLSVQIMYRMEHPEAPYELTFIKPEILYKDSVLY